MATRLSSRAPPFASWKFRPGHADQQNAWYPDSMLPDRRYATLLPQPAARTLSCRLKTAILYFPTGISTGRAHHASPPCSALFPHPGFHWYKDRSESRRPRLFSRMLYASFASC